MDHKKFSALAPVLIRDLMDDLSISAMDACAILGNLGHESNGFATLQEVKPTVAGSRGGYGWAQWTGPRRRQYEDFCKAGNMDPSSDGANYAFLLHELKGPEKRAIPLTQKANTLMDKVIAFESAYERAGTKHYKSRMIWAERALDAYKAHTPTTNPKGNTVLPSLFEMLFGSTVRAALMALAGVLTTLGMLQPGQTDSFITIGLGLVTGAISFIWSLVQKNKVAKVAAPYGLLKI